VHPFFFLKENPSGMFFPLYMHCLICMWFCLCLFFLIFFFLALWITTMGLS
jgi:hypothetical protein